MAVSGSLRFAPLDARTVHLCIDMQNPTDALCSSSDETHDALMTLYHNRFAEQIETAESEEILAAWQ